MVADGFFSCKSSTAFSFFSCDIIDVDIQLVDVRCGFRDRRNGDRHDTDQSLQGKLREGESRKGLDGLSIKETGAVLNISEELVRKRCERARKLLKSTLINLKKERHHER